MRALVIGCGAIGQVFGRHLQLGGAELAFLVRPRQVAEARSGFAMYPLNRGSRERGTAVDLVGFGVFDDLDAALASPWDLVVFAMSSVALAAGDWLARLGQHLGDARVLVLQPGLEDRDHVLAHVPASRVAYGMLAVVSFQAPLPGDTLARPGVAYWFPWLSAIGFSGQPAVVDEVMRVLAAGAMPVARVRDVHAEVAFTGAILDKTVTALQVAGWSFVALRADRGLFSLAHRSMQESWALAAATLARPIPWYLSLVRPALLRAVLAAAPRLLPFDLERFFHYHYVKVMEQSLLEQDRQLARFATAGVPCPATSQLAARMRAAAG